MSSDRDAGFCSGGDEDLEGEDDLHSPTDASEDSIEVKVTPVSSRNKNKRKSAEPRKVPNEEQTSGPLKKRIRFDIKQDFAENERHSPFRPWTAPSTTPSPPLPSYHPVYGYHCPIQQDEPLPLVKSRPESPRRKERRKEKTAETDVRDNTDRLKPSSSDNDSEIILKPKDFARIKMDPLPRVPPHPGVRPSSASELDSLSRTSKISPGFSVESLLSPKSLGHSSKDRPQKEQRNYKNMTRERRIEANARERTRVHTISAAFDTLRRAIPAYSHNQKLSKLSVLRIACSYILTLSRVAGNDYSSDQSSPSLSSCVALVSRTIQTEGKLRKKKDD